MAYYILCTCSVKQLQSNLSTRVCNAKLQKWPLLTGGLCSECQKLPMRNFSLDELRLLAGVPVHMFGCIDLVDTCIHTFHTLEYVNMEELISTF